MKAWNFYWNNYKPIQHIIGKPFFRKWIQARCDEVVLRLSDTDNQSEMIVKHPWNQITELFKALEYVHRYGLNALLITIKHTLITY
jgi:hypothetical protein